MDFELRIRKLGFELLDNCMAVAVRENILGVPIGGLESAIFIDHFD